jgi:hypothetical protein
MLPLVTRKNFAKSNPGLAIERFEAMASQSDLILLCCRFDKIRFQRQGVDGWSDGRFSVLQRQGIELNGREESFCALHTGGNLDIHMTDQVL